MNNTIYVRLDYLVSISNGKQHRVVWHNKGSDHHNDRDISIIVTKTSMWSYVCDHMCVIICDTSVNSDTH